MAAPFGDFGVSGRAGTCSSVSSFAEVMNIITTNVVARVKGSVAMKNMISAAKNREINGFLR